MRSPPTIEDPIATEPTEARARASSRVEVSCALFDHETTAREAVQLLGWHGFREDDIHVVPARGRLLRPLDRPTAVAGPRRAALWIGLGVGAVVGLIASLLVPTLPLELPSFLLVVVGAGIGAVAGALVGSAPTVEGLPTETTGDPAARDWVPEAGALVVVRSLRGFEARHVLARADGRPVRDLGPAEAPEESGDDRQ